MCHALSGLPLVSMKIYLSCNVMPFLQDLCACAATNPLVFKILRTMIPSKTQCDSFLMLVNADVLAMALHEPNETGLQPLHGAWKQESADVAFDLLAGFKRQGTACDCCTTTSQQTCCQKELYNNPPRSCSHPLQGSQCLTNPRMPLDSRSLGIWIYSSICHLPNCCCITFATTAY